MKKNIVPLSQLLLLLKPMFLISVICWRVWF
ncbi:Uncharacterised protein [Vibrio cholerae]|nr:Uncharacterised protein [Vibrio cholerae]